MSDRLTNIIRRIFDIPSWYLPTESEINRLYDYVRTEGNINRAKVARVLDCSAFCQGKDCFFCSDIRPVFSYCKCDERTKCERSN